MQTETAIRLEMAGARSRHASGRAKKFLKQAIFGLATIAVLPLAVPELILRRLAGRDVLFAGQAEWMSLFPGKLGWYLRNAYYHLTLRRCPPECCFLFGALFTHSEAEVGERVYVGARCIIGMAKVGDDTMLSDHVQILSGRRQHGSQEGPARFQDQPRVFSLVSIGRNCWLGAGAIVMANVGENCVIGAGSVVTHPIPDNSVAVGAPARVIRSEQGRPAHGD